MLQWGSSLLRCLVLGIDIDEADFAEQKIEAAIEAGIEQARFMLAKTTLKACGVCHYCGTGLRNAGGLFCDDDCRKDYVYEQRCKHIAGKF